MGGSIAADLGVSPGIATRGWRRYWQIVPLAVVLWALDAVDKFRAGTQAAGLLHAPVINDISDRLGGSVAVLMNRWTSTHPLAAAPATACYIVLHVLVTGTVGVLLLRSGHPSFGPRRNALIVSGVIGLAVFWAYPVAPPRMLPGAAVLASPRGYPGLQFGSLLLGAWLIISPFVLDEKFPIAHPMYWSNCWSGGVLMALALAGLAVSPRPAR